MIMAEPQRFPGLTNYVVPVPGTNVTCYIGVRDAAPDTWFYSLWSGRDGQEGDTKLVATGDVTIDHLFVTPQQVARIAFLLEVDYADAPEPARYASCGCIAPCPDHASPKQDAREDHVYWTERYDTETVAENDQA
jgi:hypothetical protein